MKKNEEYVFFLNKFLSIRKFSEAARTAKKRFQNFPNYDFKKKLSKLFSNFIKIFD
jgi:hypothetical protein